MTQADLFGVPHAFELDGQTYEFKKPDQIQQGVYQRWLEQRARESVGRATDVPERERDELLRAVQEDIATFRYEYGGPACARSLQTASGVAKMIEIVCQVPPGVARRIAERRRDLIAELWRARLADDPKAAAAALVSLGLPPDFLASKETSSPPSSTPPSTAASPNSGGSPTTSSGASGGTSGTSPAGSPTSNPSPPAPG